MCASNDGIVGWAFGNAEAESEANNDADNETAPVDHDKGRKVGAVEARDVLIKHLESSHAAHALFRADSERFASPCTSRTREGCE